LSGQSRRIGKNHNKPINAPCCERAWRISGLVKWWRCSIQKECKIMVAVAKPRRKRKRTYIREWRRFATDYSQSAVAKLIGYDHSSVQRMEKGLIPYDQDWLEQLANLYGCEPWDLISRDPNGSKGIRSDVWAAYSKAPADVQQQVMAVVKTMLGMN
jgi:Helix-turn-helix domain